MKLPGSVPEHGFEQVTKGRMVREELFLGLTVSTVQVGEQQGVSLFLAGLPTSVG